MQTIKEFMDQQEKALDKKRKEIAEVERLGPVPGLAPYMVHGTHHGYRHIAFKLVDIEAFVAWVRDHAEPIYAIEGKYASLLPIVPDYYPYSGSKVKCEGRVVVTYCSINRRFESVVYHKGFKLSVELPFTAGLAEMRPIGSCAATSINPSIPAKIKWSKPACNFKQNLKFTSKDFPYLETLLSLDQFEVATKVDVSKPRKYG